MASRWWIRGVGCLPAAEVPADSPSAYRQRRSPSSCGDFTSDGAENGCIGYTGLRVKLGWEAWERVGPFSEGMSRKGVTMSARCGGNRIRAALLVIALGLVWSTFPVPQVVAQPAAVSAENPAQTPGQAVPTMELVERRLKEVDQLQGVEEAARTELRSIYQEALHELTSARDLAGQTKSLADIAAAADENLQEAQLEVSRTPAAVPIEFPPDATLAKLEELVSAEEKKLDAAKQRKEKLDLEVGRRQGRRAEIPGRIQQLQDARKALETEWNSVPAGGGPRSDALQTRIAARRLAIDQEIADGRARTGDLRCHNRSVAAGVRPGRS